MDQAKFRYSNVRNSVLFMTHHCEGDVRAALPQAASRRGVEMFSSSQNERLLWFHTMIWMPITLVME